MTELTDNTVAPQATKKAISKYIEKQIAESELGAMIREEIDVQVQKHTFNNKELSGLISAAVTKAIEDSVASPKIKARIEKAVRQRIDDVVVKELTDKAMASLSIGKTE